MKIAIVGYGLEGRANYQYYLQQGHCLTIVDERDKVDDLPDDAHVILGPYAFSQLTDFDMIIRSAGVAPHKLPTTVPVWSSTNEFLRQCHSPVIGVTGSKGKGTTSSYIAEMLRASGKTVELVGNIGLPALSRLEEANAADVVVYEMSSFQLWDAESSPTTAVVLHIEPDHLDVHASFDDYIDAKSHIVRFMRDGQYAYVHPSNEFSQRIVARTAAQVVKYADENEGISYIKDGMIWRDGRAITSIGSVKLPGEHNLENVCAAIGAVREYNVSDEAVVAGIEAFEGLPHRLKFVREHRGIRFYDDSIATTPGSTIAALHAFSEPKIVILGGSSKGADYKELAAVLHASGVKKAILIGDEADTLEEALTHVDVSYVRLGKPTMARIVEEAEASAEPGDVVLISPAAASFDMFTSYSDRGDQFIAAVNELP